jgi:hypothetical protein
MTVDTYIIYMKIITIHALDSINDAMAIISNAVNAQSSMVQ